jgi:hypothetical protein
MLDLKQESEPMTHLEGLAWLDGNIRIRFHKLRDTINHMEARGPNGGYADVLSEMRQVLRLVEGMQGLGVNPELRWPKDAA